MSHHQGAIDWPRVSTSPNFRVVYVKATEGADWVDSRFLENWEGARRAGLRVGAYHLFSFCSEPLLQANNFLSKVPRTGDSLAPVVDLEFGGNCRKVPSKEVLLQNLGQFMTAVEQGLSKKPMIYVTREAYDAFLADTGLELRRAWRVGDEADHAVPPERVRVDVC